MSAACGPSLTAACVSLQAFSLFAKAVGTSPNKHASRAAAANKRRARKGSARGRGAAEGYVLAGSPSLPFVLDRPYDVPSRLPPLECSPADAQDPPVESSSFYTESSLAVAGSSAHAQGSQVWAHPCPPDIA
jgi:hypothetical protein